MQGYGLTETSPVVAIGTNKNYRLGSIGKTVPSVEAKLDEEGYIFICGRKKSVIVLKNGKNIFPEEYIESQYIKNRVPIKVSNQLQTEIIYKANKVLNLYKHIG